MIFKLNDINDFPNERFNSISNQLPIKSHEKEIMASKVDYHKKLTNRFSKPLS